MDRFYDLDEGMHRYHLRAWLFARVWRIVTERQSAIRPGQASGVPEEHHLDIVLAEHFAIHRRAEARDADAAAPH